MKKFEVNGDLILPFSFVGVSNSKKEIVERLEKILTNWILNYDTNFKIISINGEVHNININDVEYEIADVIDYDEERSVY